MEVESSLFVEQNGLSGPSQSECGLVLSPSHEIYSKGWCYLLYSLSVLAGDNPKGTMARENHAWLQKLQEIWVGLKGPQQMSQNDTYLISLMSNDSNDVSVLCVHIGIHALSLSIMPSLKENSLRRNPS